MSIKQSYKVASSDSQMNEIQARLNAVRNAGDDLREAQLRHREANLELTRVVFSAGMFEALTVNHARLQRILNRDQ